MNGINRLRNMLRPLPVCLVIFTLMTGCAKQLTKQVPAGTLKKIGFVMLDYDTSRMLIYNKMNESYRQAMTRELPRYRFEQVMPLATHVSAYTFHPAIINDMLAGNGLDALIICRVGHVNTTYRHLYTRSSATLQLDFHLKVIGRDGQLMGETFRSVKLNDFGKQPAVISSMTAQALKKVLKNFKK